MDIVLGSTPGAFSAGELTYIVRPGFFTEYCSCGSTIADCPQWEPIFREWRLAMEHTAHGEITFDRYCALRHRFEGNKALHRTIWNRFFPSKDWKRYVMATEVLYDLIHEHTKASVIIDSSKVPSRMFLLARFTAVQGVHLCRSFKGVLNSEKKVVRADLTNGLEADSPPKSTSAVLRNWLLTNLACAITALFHPLRKIRFSSLMVNPLILRNLNPDLPIDLTSYHYKAEHMAAGNAIRMMPPQKFRTGHTTSFERLSVRDARIADRVDRLFRFWS